MWLRFVFGAGCVVDFVVGDVVRQGFGFANPNHAAAAICALFPFCWGWGGGWRWAGRIAGVALCVMLAMTYSRTGMAVLAMEAGALWLMQSRFPFSTQRRRDAESAEDALELARCARTGGVIGRVEHAETCRTSTRSARSTRLNRMQGRGGLATSVVVAVVVAAIALWWMWPRLALDGAILNRPKIWLAGLGLFAANPMGVGFGNSGEIASAFMLPDGITVRTLVNSHLTLLVEMGVFVGGAWLAFIALALCAGRKLRRTWVAFAGLAVSAFSASVFDWHVLFDFAEKGGYGTVNFVLAWGLFVAFVVMGAAIIGIGVLGNNINNVGQHVMERGLTSPRKVVVRAGMVCASVLVALVASVLLARRDATPRVEGEYVVCGRRWNAVPTDCGGGAPGSRGPCVYRDGEWSLEAVAKRFPDGARFRVRPGVPEDAEDSGDVWLFGDAAESAWRFPNARITLVAPPEFSEIPTNAVVVSRLAQGAK